MLIYRLNSENKYELIDRLLETLKGQFKAQLLGDTMGLVTAPDLRGIPRDVIDRLMRTDLSSSDPDTMPTEVKKQIVGVKNQAMRELRDHLQIGLKLLDKQIS